MDLKIDTVIVIDSWWNIPDEIVQKMIEEKKISLDRAKELLDQI